MAAPTKQELSILLKFRQRLQDLKLDGEMSTDMYMLRWLRAREMNLDQSEDMLRKSLKWRQENNLDTILTWKAPQFLVQNYQYEFSEFDTENSPVAIIPFGRWNLKKLIQIGHKKDYIRYIDQMFENLLQQMKTQFTNDGTRVTQFVFIVDMEGLSMSTLACKGAIEAIFENVVRFESNYPETLKASYVINASRVFTILFSLVKPLLSPRTFGKVHVFNSDITKWQDAIFKSIPRDQLPLPLGGTNPKTSCLDKNQPSSNELDTKVMTVGPGSTEALSFNVDQKGTILHWSFQTNYNISYSLIFMEETQQKILIEGQRVESSEGSWPCSQLGLYIFKFNNSFSRLRSKVVNYRIDLIVSNEE